MSGPSRVILVDGSSLIYRAYFAIPSNFSTASGLHTNATYGFATMFRKLLAGKMPERAAVVFDAPGKTFREERYAEYKAQRPRMDWELREQLEWIDKVVDVHKWPRLRVPGYEADDVIGTLAREALEADMEVHIISGDKDFAQLIGERVRMVDTLRDITYDPELVRKKWGVPPEQFVDWLALVGDKVDNIPGVPGIGAKGAAQLLAKYGSLEGLLANTHELKGKRKANVEASVDVARLSRELATIDRHASLELGLDDLRVEPPDAAAVNALFRELEFFSLLAEDEQGGDDEVDAEADYQAFTSVAQVEAWVSALPTGARPAVLAIHDLPSAVTGELAALVLSAEPGQARLLPLWCEEGLEAAGLAALGPWLEDPNAAKTTYDAKRLWIALKRRGVDLAGVSGDVLLESFLVDPTKIIPHRLDQVVREYLHTTIAPAKRVLGSGKKLRAFSDLSSDELLRWCCAQGDAVARCWPLVRERLEGEGHLDVLFDVDLPLSWVLARMELEGIAVDPASLDSMGREFGERLADLAAQIHGHAGHAFNIGSPKQLSKVLFEELELPVIKRTKSGYSTNAEVLERLVPKHPIAGLLLQHRKLAKLINTYTEVLQRAVHPATGRIHATFQQCVGATGRLISTEPDLQRTPVKTPEGKRIRQTFVPRAGAKLIAADWSQIELRLLAHFTKDPRLVEAFAEGLDVHARTAGQLFECEPEAITSEQRGVGKLVNFATIYGQGATALGQILGVPRKQAQAYIDGYFAAYAGVRRWLDDTMETAHEHGYVTTLLGRRRYIPELSSNAYMERQAGERIAANTPIQGSAADICKLAMLEIDRRLRDGGLATKMLLQIHDELVFEAPDNEVDAVCALVREAMEAPYSLDVPLVVDIGVGASWAEAKS